MKSRVEIVALIVVVLGIGGVVWWYASGGGGSNHVPSSQPASPLGLKDYLPVGRTTRTVVAAVVTGEAKARRDAKVIKFEGQQHFYWTWDVEYVTHVLKNDGRRVELERQIEKVRQALVMTGQRPEVKVEVTPALDFVAKRIWEALPPHIRWGALLLRQLDPKGEITGQALVEAAQRLGVQLGPQQLAPFKDPQDLAKELEGVTVRLAYVDGMGVVGGVQAAGDAPLSARAVEWLERCAAVLYQRPLVPNLNAPVGDKWDVDVHELGPLLLEPGSKEDTRGLLHLERLAPAENTSARLLRLAARGEIRIVTDQQQQSRQTGVLQIGQTVGKVAEIEFDPQLLLMSQGRFDGQATYELTEDHWLWDLEFAGAADVAIRVWTEILP